MLLSSPGISRSLGRTVALCRALHGSAGAWSYKSNISLDNIYPQSDLDITKPQEVGGGHWTVSQWRGHWPSLHPPPLYFVSVVMIDT